MKRILLVAAALSISLSSFADEGMWMVNSIGQALVQNMQNEGCRLNAKDIYDADNVSLSDAIVSLDFGCTGSMISEKGLLITNHHCAYADVHALSTPEHNYLEDGFSADFMDQEIYIPGKRAFFLQNVIDVTDEVEELIREETEEGRKFGMRHISAVIEERYNRQTGLNASLSHMWAGEKYYLALYKVYTDIRLVAAPPVSIAAFGGDIDNWEWPQHKCDFALYRIYAAPDGSPAPHSDSNVPWKPVRTLSISTEGYEQGSFAMVMGYPGKTDRYSSSAKVDNNQNIYYPILTEIRSGQMKIMMKWMNADPAIRLKYANSYFSLSNVQECQEGEMQCCRRFKVIKSKKAEERKFLKGRENRQIASDLACKYKAASKSQQNMVWYRETIAKGSKINLIAQRIRNNKKGLDLDGDYAEVDMRLERELFKFNVKSYLEHVDPEYWGPFQREVCEMFRKDDKTVDYDALCDYLWTDERMTKDDRVFKFLSDVLLGDFNARVSYDQGDTKILQRSYDYTHAMYKAKEAAGMLQYPDANSTMRLTYGTVSTFRRGRVDVPWQTWSSEILAKENPDDHDFTLKDSWRSMLESAGADGKGIPVNFLTDNDITGGNSGSPVLNADGEIIGLAFDGNKESLAGNVYWTEGWCKTISVDIRFVLWTIRNYLKMDNIMKEIALD
ncbi:MAG: S46 family peptidase [Bacteroidales bacterium]|nr:S46 family peptidase [Candidatus Cryptobacteroides choladohippi]